MTMSSNDELSGAPLRGSKKPKSLEGGRAAKEAQSFVGRLAKPGKDDQPQTEKVRKVLGTTPPKRERQGKATTLPSKPKEVEQDARKSVVDKLKKSPGSAKPKTERNLGNTKPKKLKKDDE